MSEITLRLALTDKRALEANGRAQPAYEDHGRRMGSGMESKPMRWLPQRSSARWVRRFWESSAKGARNARIPAKRFSEQAEVTDLVLFLASEAPTSWAVRWFAWMAAWRPF